MSQVKEYPVEVHLLPGGQGRVIVDGRDISHRAYKIEIACEVGKPTKAVVTFLGVEVAMIGSAWVEFQTLSVNPTLLVNPQEHTGIR